MFADPRITISSSINISFEWIILSERYTVMSACLPKCVQGCIHQAARQLERLLRPQRGKCSAFQRSEVEANRLAEFGERDDHVSEGNDAQNRHDHEMQDC